MQQAMAIPDAEYARIEAMVSQRSHSSGVTLLTREKERMRFFRSRGGEILACRIIGGKEVAPSLCVPMSKAIPGGEAAFTAAMLKKQHPDWSQLRIDDEIALIGELRTSVQRLVETTGCKPADALRLLEMGLVSHEMKEKEDAADAKAEAEAREATPPE